MAAKQEAEAAKVGDPRREDTTIGPLVSRAQFEKVQRFINQGIQEGATLVTGGSGLPEAISRGYFARPTVFAEVRNDMSIAREEIFGPVLCIIPYEDEDDAVRIAAGPQVRVPPLAAESREQDGQDRHRLAMVTHVPVGP